MELASRHGGLVVANAFHPNIAIVGQHNAPRNGQAQPRPATLKFGFAGRVQGDFTSLIKLGKDEFVVVGVYANACVVDGDVDRLTAVGKFGRPMVMGVVQLPCNRHGTPIGGVFNGV